MRRGTLISALVIALLTLAGCQGVPSHVIQPEEMARLMADLRVANSVVSLNAARYRDDSARYALRQAVFDRHGVTVADFDTSLVWYGHNIGKYQEVTERSIELLEERQRDIAARTSALSAMSLSGDSVDVWPLPASVAVTRRSPSGFLTFSFPADTNFRPGDTYTWRVKFLVPPREVRWSMAAEYVDGSVETAPSTITVSEPGRRELTFMTDSTRDARYVTGWLEVVPDGNKPVLLDSISLMRRRVGDTDYNPGYRQRKVVMGGGDKDKDNDAKDSIPA